MSRSAVTPSFVGHVPVTLDNFETLQDAWNYKNERSRRNFTAEPQLDSPRSLEACRRLHIDAAADLRKYSLRMHLNLVMGQRQLLAPYEGVPLAQQREAAMRFTEMGVNMGTTAEKFAAVQRYTEQERRREALLAKAQRERGAMGAAQTQPVARGAEERGPSSPAARVFAPAVDSIGESAYLPRDTTPVNFMPYGNRAASLSTPTDDPAGVLTPLTSAANTPAHPKSASGDRGRQRTAGKASDAVPSAQDARPPFDCASAVQDGSVLSVGSSQLEWVLKGSTGQPSPDVRVQHADPAVREPRPVRPFQPQQEETTKAGAARSDDGGAASVNFEDGCSVAATGAASPLSFEGCAAYGEPMSADELEAGYFYYCANPTPQTDFKP